ncbi:MAG: hypothetical protein J7494_11255 [Sphingobium sp.]|nr:hypothetical protein [Sphingobium sp.]
MPISIIIVILVIGVLVAFWLIRSRGNTAGQHIDTSLTALGAVTEAVEEAVDAITGKAEPEAQAAPAKPQPAPAPAPAKASGAPDDLRLMKGVGPKLATLLNTLGVTRFDQIAAWSAADIETIDAQLGTFKGRITRDSWVEQAGLLAKGDTAGFEAKFGKLGG